MPPRPEIKFVWFDMGNVLMHFSRKRQAEALQALPGCQRAIDEIIPFIDGRSQEHLAYELGHLTRESFLIRLAAFLGTSAPPDQVDEAYATLFTRNDPVCRLAATIAQALPVGLATNSDPSHLARVQRDEPAAMGLFPEDRTMASFRCGHRKPDREFFECMIKQSEYPADALCFIDDLQANVEAAKEASIINSLSFGGDVDQLIADLAALKVLV
jgi:HAD superfamily hydrolase (TIGR01509 family)